ncbi:MAG: methyl-accepting chemotaxis protein [Agathobacter sp.]|nr:methyl-accepting chemotaxis protein [Agathobacter sp.]
MQKKKGMSMGMKLVMVVIPIVLVLIVSFFALSRNMVIKLSQEKLDARSKVYTEEISTWTNQILGELQIYQDTIEEGAFSNDQETLQYLETTLEKNPAYPYGLYMGDDTGIYLDGSGWEPGDDWVLVERDWYVDGKDNESFAFGEPYYDSMTGQVCVSASVRVDYDKAVRVLASDVYLDLVADQVETISNEEEEDAFLVTQGSQTIIAHVDTEMMAVTLGTDGIDPLYTAVGKALEEGKTGVISINGKGGKYYVCLNEVEHTDWYLVTYVKESTVLADLHKMEIIMALIGTAAAVILIVVILQIMNRIVKPVRKMTDVIDKIAEGDFSQNIETKGNDEIARMSSNMQMFIQHMRSTISEISGIAGWLERQSVENGEVSDSLQDSSKKQEQEMGMLGDMVEQLSEAVENASSQMDNLADLIQQANDEGEAAERLMEESVVMSKSGKNDMVHIHTGMANINSSITVLSDQLDKVGDIVSQIGNMVRMIVDIAEETNLLSLNASIEAARAGEAGRGFSVVAEQIGKLATNSSAAADEISKLTDQIQTTMNEAVQHMNESVEEVQANVEVVSEASATFEGLYQKVEETNQRVNQMIDLVGKVEEVSGMMKEISRNQVQAADQIAQSAEGLNQQTRNVTSGSSLVAESADELKKESMELMNRISQFKV